MRHAELLHNPARPRVRRDSGRDDFWETQSLKTITYRRLRTFGRQTLSPVFHTKPPADFYGVRCVVAGNVETDKPGERPITPKLGRPEAESVLTKMSSDPVHHSIAFLPRRPRGKKLHHPWICIHAGE